ncbi:M14 family zinc carboxypeptidase [Thalassotalea sp. PLHSN55]|uniref:M14 family zinc carboxypeptidase n=1 Tax=Thalassotalea sp. PLHSN55 TaxID=3435888 RepID=UPI003F83EF13
MTYSRFILGCLLVLMAATVAVAAPVHSYLPEGELYNSQVVAPEKVLGFEIGDRHVRHDQLVSYFQQLASSSSRVKLTQIGRTNELRSQLLVTISAEQNLANLDELLAKRSFLNTNKAKKSADEPLVIWLGYSVHGDEISGANAAMVVAYYLGASNSESIKQLLDNTILVLEPSMNPDGMDRFVNWVNTHRNSTINTNPDHIEHHQPWRTGRTNHFGFDLNRDWLLLTQQETINRLPYFYQYQPNILGDFHEMGSHSSYFFQPGIPTRNNPLTPKANIELTTALAKYHATALDQQQQLYFSQESFDDFYYGKGSTYPDISGGIGILFEQASSRGMVQKTANGDLTFAQGIQNHVTTSLSTIHGAWQNRDSLKNYRNDFYQSVEGLVDDENYHGYLIQANQDSYRVNELLAKLTQHKIDVFALASDYRADGVLYPKGRSFYVPLNQPQYRIIKTLFAQPTQFNDNSFYDVSGWTMSLALDLNVKEIKRSRSLKLAQQTWQASAAKTEQLASDAYAYAFEWHHYLAPKLLQQLLSQGVKAKVTTKAFSAKVVQGSQKFGTGSIVIPSGIEQPANWQSILTSAAQNIGIELFAISSGLSVEGVDLGSGSIKPLKPIEVLLVGGKGISQYETAEVLFYLDKQLGIPVTVVEKQRLNKIELSRYSHMIMVDGSYADFSDAMTAKIELWIKHGGTLVAQKRAAKWSSEKGLLNANFVSKKQINQMFDTSDLPYQDKANLASRKRISGAIYQTQLDTSHPLAYGFTDQNLPMFRNSNLIMDLPSTPFITVAQYSKSPLLSGYTDKNLVNRIANNAAVIAHNVGKGRVIATTENLTFRGYWQGTAKLLANSLFFSHVFSAY